ncbi:hypothetical protein [Pedobacter sp.]|jgi:hypothetical protein|uniref:hypothetical protein n=1 Tax=Pedobacter sp. TaxID=1411316 RepID=UPI002BB1AEDD|nr:hypothetical protein [Pedobacter sp.]HWW39664.1 hypothetical protein [Pedobacter sp.]
MMPDNTPHEPTEKTRAEVAALVSFGNSQEEIANFIGVHINTLVKYYRDELDNSIVRANAKVAAKLFRKAIDGDDIKAQIFWLKTRARWREKDRDDDTTNAASLLEKIMTGELKVKQ